MPKSASMVTNWDQLSTASAHTCGLDSTTHPLQCAVKRMRTSPVARTPMCVPVNAYRDREPSIAGVWGNCRPLDAAARAAGAPHATLAAPRLNAETAVVLACAWACGPENVTPSRALARVDATAR